MGRLVWTEPAVEDVLDITAYVARDSRAYARKLRRRIMQAPKILKKHPHFGWKVTEFDQEHFRELLVAPYRIIYTLRGQDCYIVAVVHGSRDLTRKVNPASFDEPETDRDAE